MPRRRLAEVSRQLAELELAESIDNTARRYYEAHQAHRDRPEAWATVPALASWYTDAVLSYGRPIRSPKNSTRAMMAAAVREQSLPRLTGAVPDDELSILRFLAALMHTRSTRKAVRLARIASAIRSGRNIALLIVQERDETNDNKLRNDLRADGVLDRWMRAMRAQITLALDDGADPHIIETRVTHTKKSRSAFDGYNRGRQWEITCAEISKLKITRQPRGQLVQIPAANAAETAERAAELATRLATRAATTEKQRRKVVEAAGVERSNWHARADWIRSLRRGYQERVVGSACS